jgi:hypothetical protein
MGDIAFTKLYNVSVFLDDNSRMPHPVSLAFTLKKNVHYAVNSTLLQFVGGVQPDKYDQVGPVFSFNPGSTLMFTGTAFN